MKCNENKIQIYAVQCGDRNLWAEYNKHAKKAHK